MVRWWGGEGGVWGEGWDCSRVCEVVACDGGSGRKRHGHNKNAWCIVDCTLIFSNQSVGMVTH